ncbi:MAG: PEFG-CTERM sorting domain-containing protein [Thaumarchaeota archaeon]|nr:PEFG-CTERM sorting domain-containing protein [Nitrososphaerota archaeon]
MKSKPMGALFGVLALVAIIAIAQPAFATNVSVTISKGASGTNGKCDPTSCFNPQVVNANVGDTVTWTNADSAAHTATYYDGNESDTSVGTIWDSGMIKASSTYTTPAFTKAGTFPYFCEVHPWMTGQVIVGAAGATNPPPTSGNNMTTTNMTGNTGNQTVPEFGPVASLVLVIAIISVVIFTAKTRAIPKL